MTREEFKAKITGITGITAEGADTAAIVTELLDDYGERLDEIAAGAEKEAKIAELSATIAKLNETNMKLIERLKYQDDPDPEESEDEITLENLFD